ncbi:hypothetical protein WA026_006114, partial [Henosepilachna vigintioctopunctata]
MKFEITFALNTLTSWGRARSLLSEGHDHPSFTRQTHDSNCPQTDLNVNLRGHPRSY